MSKLHYTELFYSIQGEGRYIGVPSIFLRTFGCNFRCRNFNRDKNDTSDNQDVINVIKNINNYNSFEELPIIKTGCDSYSSVYPEFKSFVKQNQINELVNDIINLLPDKQWNHEHLVITGGEPLLGWQRAYPELLFHSNMQQLKELTFETNGTQPITDDFESQLIRWTSARFNTEALTFSVSPKLSESGESWEDAIKPDVVAQYNQLGFTYLKFVISNKDSIKEVDEAVNLYDKAGFDGPVYLMPVGGTTETYMLNARQVAELALQKGYRYSARLHVDLWQNAWGT